MDGLSLRQLNGGDDEDAALRRAMALSIRDEESARTGRAGNAAAGASQSPAYDRAASTASTASDASTASGSHATGQAKKKELNDTLSATQGTASSGSAACASAGATSRDDTNSHNGGEQVLPAAASAASAASVAAASAPSLLALDRKAMEAERLARRQKQLEAQRLATEGGSSFPHSHEQKKNISQPPNSERAAPPPTPSKPTKRKAEGDIIVIDDDDDDKDNGKNKEDTAAHQHQVPPLARRRKIDEHGSRPEHIVFDNSANVIGRGQRKGKGTAVSGGRTLASWSPEELDEVTALEAVPASTAVSMPASMPASTPAATAPPSSALRFAKGAVKKTWARGQPRRGDDITIAEIWQKDQLELAILSSFQWDDEWMMSHVNVAKTRLLLIAYAADDNQKEEMAANVPSDRIRFCFPRMQTMGHMHSKLQLLKFPGFLRIVVPTGNLTPYDWGETGTIENMAFIIDLPRQSKDERARAMSTPFQEDLCYFLAAQGVDEAMISSLQNFDYSETARYAFVHTMSGSHTGAAAKRTGYAGLGRAVNALCWDTTEPVQLDYICSSIGALSDDLTTALYYACQGDTGMKEFESRTSRSRKPKAKGQSQLAPASQSGPKDCMRIYFPSHETVLKSAGGVNGAGTICFQRKWWEAPAFPREMFRDGQNVRNGVLLHTKLLLVRWPEETGACRGWAYVGSANMSESAWGRMVKDRASGKMKMNCRSWECGVLVPASTDDSVPVSLPSPPSSTEDAYMLDVFRGTLPVPISVPASKYGGGKQPWFFMERN